jgi:hypothetical protein
MPKLYYTPTSCGAASFIAAFVAGVKLDAEQGSTKFAKYCKQLTGINWFANFAAHSRSSNPPHDLWS